jgi:hypothetical protein
MNNIIARLTLIFLLFPYILNGQSDPENTTQSEETRIIYGFVRGGLYGGIDNEDDDKPYIPSAFADLGLKIETEEGKMFNAYADLRFRYGTEFREPVNRFDIRELYIGINGKKWDITAGQKIIKWGRADFTNPTSKFSPQNLISRSPDKEDIDMGNLLVNARWHPFPRLTLEAVVTPYYRSSVLMIDPIPLPSYVTINPINSLVTGNDMFGYGLKANMHLTGADMSLSWFDGYDPMPGTALTRFSLNLTDPIPVPNTELTMKPYKIRNIGLDFETTAGSIGIRGEAGWSLPYDSYKTYEYVACQELEWAAGIDWMPGSWRITAEYSGKFIPDFEESAVDPIIGSELDLSQMAALMATPGFDLTEYVRQQVGAFNRLYNYQLKKLYHSAGIRIETDLFYGKLTPSLTSLYNFTSRDLLVMPEVIYKPADGLTIILGGEFYSGREGSIYDIVDEFMNCIRVSLRVDF